MGRVAILAAVLAFAGSAQPAFEVASLKPSAGPPANHQFACSGGPGTTDPGFFRCQSTPVSMLIMHAYHVHRYQLSAPAAITGMSAMYDVTARVPEGTSGEQLLLMEQRLLAERFQLKLHREQKELPVYELTVGPNGPKLSPAGASAPETPANPSRDLAFSRDGFPRPPPGLDGMIVMRDRRVLNAPHKSLEDLAETLSVQLGRPVLNASGLAGQYDMVLNWMIDEPGVDPGPTLERAVEQQLGLKLSSQKSRIDILVIDHLAQTPVEN